MDFHNVNAITIEDCSMFGSLPSLGPMTGLKSLNLMGNSFSGIVPPMPMGLESLRLGSNMFDTIFPAHVTLLPLVELNLEKNLISGPLPESFEFLGSTLVDLRLNDNLIGSEQCFLKVDKDNTPATCNRYLISLEEVFKGNFDFLERLYLGGNRFPCPYYDYSDWVDLSQGAVTDASRYEITDCLISTVPPTVEPFFVMDDAFPGLMVISVVAIVVGMLLCAKNIETCLPTTMFMSVQYSHDREQNRIQSISDQFYARHSEFARDREERLKKLREQQNGGEAKKDVDQKPVAKSGPAVVPINGNPAELEFEQLNIEIEVESPKET